VPCFPIAWRPEGFAESVAARSGNPVQPAGSIWANVDARDAARADRPALEDTTPGIVVALVTRALLS
jgi:hypothetical protein